MADRNTPGQDKVGEAFDSAVRWLHGKGEFTPEMIKESPVRALINETTATLNRGISLGVGSDTISGKMAEGLRGSTYMFSGFKSFHEMKEAAALLVDENGNRKPFNRYLKDVQAINSQYNVQYLRAEYEFASASAQMAAKWEELSEDEDRYELQYRTAGDGKVRKAHRELDGITLPASDPFWDSYYPPNGWNCRCTVTKVRKGKYAASDSKLSIKKGQEATVGKYQEMFRFHPGKQRAAYPAYNSYTVAKCGTCSKDGFKLAKVPNNELCQACGIIKEMKKEKEKLTLQRKEVAQWAKDNLAGKSVLVNKISNPVEFTMNGIKETINKPHRKIFAKNEALRNIIQLLKDGSYVMERKEDKGNPMVHKYHYVKIEIDGEDSYAVVRELIDGREQFYAIVEKLKGKE